MKPWCGHERHGLGDVGRLQHVGPAEAVSGGLHGSGNGLGVGDVERDDQRVRRRLFRSSGTRSGLRTTTTTLSPPWRAARAISARGREMLL
ncbi:hypothetical protein FXN61_25515 [Lentzea sp. PSKA42]|uniref:Uncharacterized protein n=1 Tax=Lentzea indica TaxID=2604800 RepID=A0ABX1FMF3_9PSEU|nr:hypothetical protein [Lentzea indica]NKE59974.1 hypothetical protein [Lentzea indica]